MQCWHRSHAPFASQFRLNSVWQQLQPAKVNAFLTAIGQFHDNSDVELAGPHSRRPGTSTFYKTIDLQ